MKQILIGILCFALGCSIFIGSTLHSKNKFNDGECSKCHTEYTTAHYIENGTEWIKFKCKDCGKIGYIRAYNII